MHPRGLRSLLLSLALAAAAHAQNTFFGPIDTRLHVDGSTSSPAVLNPITLPEAQRLGLNAAPGDKLWAGELALPKGGRLRYRVVVVRSTGGNDLLYIDEHLTGHFERIAFQAADKQADPRLKSMAATVVDLPEPLFPTCFMRVWLLRDGIPSPAREDQLIVAYTSLPFVQGQAILPGRELTVGFQYDFDTHSVSLTHGREWIDLKGDDSFDILRAHGTVPVFKIGNRTLHVTSVDLQSHQFVVASTSVAANRRIPLTIGTQLPDFTYTDFGGRPRHLSDVKGRYVLLDFWATWCPSCMADLPRLKQTYATFHPQGLEILGMDGDESAEKAQIVMQQKGLTWPQARYDSELVEDRFQISQWPTLVLIDLSKGQRTIVSIGQPDYLPLDGDHLAATLTTLLAQEP